MLKTKNIQLMLERTLEEFVRKFPFQLMLHDEIELLYKLKSFLKISGSLSKYSNDGDQNVTNVHI